MRGWSTNRPPARTSSPNTRPSAPRRRAALPEPEVDGASDMRSALSRLLEEELAGVGDLDVQPVLDERLVEPGEKGQLLLGQRLQSPPRPGRDVSVLDLLAGEVLQPPLDLGRERSTRVGLV